MNVIVISSSPNTDGLTAACAAAAVEGVLQGDGHAEEIRLNDLQAGLCQACGDGWGTCLPDHECQFDLIPVNRWSREYKLAAIREAARAMVRHLSGSPS